MTASDMPSYNDNMQENFDDFFNLAICGYVITDAKGVIIRINKRIAEWMNLGAEQLIGKKFSDMFTIGGKIYYETHLSPLLKMQGFFDEVVLELRNHAGQKSRVMLNGYERKDADNNTKSVCFTILKASDRLQYEQNLKEAKASAERELDTQMKLVELREQLIAVLGHDLRNPLSALKMALELIEIPDDELNTELLAILKRSCYRMSELVSNIMDFARTRLGEGIVLKRREVQLENVLSQIVADMKLVYPNREITALFELSNPIDCDPDRINQLITNLLANALTHGAEGLPVHLHALNTSNNLQISVSNKGIPIPAEFHKILFTPFTKDSTRASQNGLGLGLYISSEIAKAHQATLGFTSNQEETRFTFDMSF